MDKKTKSLLVLSSLFFLLIIAWQWLPLADASPALVCEVPGDFGTIQAAVADPDCETINVGNGIFTENVTIDRMVTIAGQGADHTEVNGNASDSVFTMATEDLVTLKDLKITNGFADSGGGISNVNGMVIIENSTISGNSASFRGGGIFNQSAFGSASMTIIDSVLSDNSAEVRGGGLENEGDDATVTIVDSTFDNNSASEGGGIYNLGTVSIDNSLLNNNSATQGGGVYNSGLFTSTNSTYIGNSAVEKGGGIHNVSGFGNVTVTLSTLNDNSASEGGGIYNEGEEVAINESILEDNFAQWGAGIYNLEGSTATAANSTLSGNEADTEGGGIWNSGMMNLFNSTLSGNIVYHPIGTSSMLGGGIYNSSGSTTIQNSTLNDNSAGIAGNSIFNNSGNVALGNSILTNNNTEGAPENCAGDDVTSEGYNLESGNTCNLTAVGDMTDTDPLLSPLVDNGGETPTHALLTGSPAIDAGNCPGEDADQRGFSRPVDMLGVPNAADACDMGAYEVHYVIYLPFMPHH